MRYVIFTDERGFRRRVMVRDTDGDEMARGGIPAGPPDLNAIDWEWLRREINNKLVEHGLFTWDDVMKSTIGLKVVETLVRRALKSAYQEQARIKSEESSASKSRQASRR